MGTDQAVVWQPERSGRLVGASKKARKPSEKTPVFLVAHGQAYPIHEPAALDALGYPKDQVRVVPRDWIDLLPEGPALRRLQTD